MGADIYRIKHIHKLEYAYMQLTTPDNYSDNVVRFVFEWVDNGIPQLIAIMLNCEC